MKKALTILALTGSVAVAQGVGDPQPVKGGFVHEIEVTALVKQFSTDRSPGIVYRGTKLEKVFSKDRFKAGAGWNVTAGIMEVSGYGHGFVGGGVSGLAEYSVLTLKLDAQALVLNSVNDYGRRETALQPAFTASLYVPAGRGNLGISATYMPEGMNELVKRRPIWIFGGSFAF